jgi:hypothetical protein
MSSGKKTAHNRAPSLDGGSMWLLSLYSEHGTNMRPGGASRGK